MYRILSKTKLNNNVEEMVIHAPFVARRCEPGQFIILRVDAEGERIPLTIAEYDRDQGTVSIIYQVVGYTTRRLSEKNAGDSIEDFVGPLGLATELHKHARVIGIGGGVGAAPLYPQLKKLSDMGVAVDLILGARSKDLILLEEKFSKFCKNIYITTDDGSYGTKGLVTDKLKELVARGEKYDEVIAIGPLVMMKFVSRLTKELNLKTSVSLNPVMVDGTGMCGGCRVTVGGQTKFVCVDGPDFDGHQVDYDELLRRQGMYKEEEAHSCKIGLRSV
ncbi:MAG TPA: sulfide/dihydroorotate dehydrogenase-like FAD/NAD-binding protein [Candidatus Omnitrophota bacterium]|nr:sulfide/dihydroorotate dehydrogenase-like FAD/NAD-binding protein [Candidatus Omnitrophota bacterium]HPS37505.1 sulfide/dihydroorotate dehydrogenase-like FAD/NAD-binding protein [Candidatus Omnitrophota bacterium]